MYICIIFWSWLLFSFYLTLILVCINSKLNITRNIWHSSWHRINNNCGLSCGHKSNKNYLRIFLWICKFPINTYDGIVNSTITKKNIINDRVRNYLIRYIYRFINNSDLQNFLYILVKKIFTWSNKILEVIQLITKNIFSSISYLAFSMGIVGNIFKIICYPKFNRRGRFIFVHILNNEDAKDIHIISNSIDLIGMSIFIYAFMILLCIGLIGYSIHYAENRHKKTFCYYCRNIDRMYLSVL